MTPYFLMANQHASKDEDGTHLKVPCPFPLMASIYGAHSGLKMPNQQDTPDWKSIKSIGHMKCRGAVSDPWGRSTELLVADAVDFPARTDPNKAWEDIEKILRTLMTCGVTNP